MAKLIEMELSLTFLMFLFKKVETAMLRKGTRLK